MAFDSSNNGTIDPCTIIDEVDFATDNDDDQLSVMSDSSYQRYGLSSFKIFLRFDDTEFIQIAMTFMFSCNYNLQL